METRASYVLVGAFLLGLISAGVVFLLWLGGQQNTADAIPLRIHFKGDVTGLDKGSNVRYRGIPVGKVQRIRIYPKNPDIIEVLVRVREDTPIWTDTVARLETQGLTGAPFVQLLRPSSSTHTPGTPPTELSPKQLRRLDEPYLIQGQPTDLQRIFQELPKAVAAITRLADHGTKLVDNGTKLIDRARGFLDEENRKKVQSILKNIETASANIESATKRAGEMLSAKNRDRVNSILKQADEAMADIRPAMKRLTSAVGNVEKSAKSFGEMSAQIEALVRENRRPIRNFTATGLFEFGQFISDFRKLVNSMERLVRRIENDPSGFFFGNRRGYRPGR
jgi:phospholipid/cholesterol/gamma-HCH transport system substrate-binding protein